MTGPKGVTLAPKAPLSFREQRIEQLVRYHRLVEIEHQRRDGDGEDAVAEGQETSNVILLGPARSRDTCERDGYARSGTP